MLRMVMVVVMNWFEGEKCSVIYTDELFAVWLQQRSMYCLVSCLDVFRKMKKKSNKLKTNLGTFVPAMESTGISEAPLPCPAQICKQDRQTIDLCTWVQS